MAVSKWEQGKERSRRYLRRRPEATELYRIVYHFHEQLEWNWESRFQQRYGCLRAEVILALQKYLDCGILAHGAARARCEKCKHSILIAFSCKQRGICPACATKRALIFAENLHENVLELVPHRHCVFSIPKRLRAFFRYDRKQHGILFRAAWQSLKELYAAVVPEGSAAAVLALHSSGDALNHNPHIHGIVASGVFLPDGTFKQLPKLKTKKLTELFTHKLLKELKQAGLVTEATIEQLLAQKQQGFSTWLGDNIEPENSDARQFVARYIDRGPVANSRIEICDDIITYQHDSEYLPTAEFDALEFLAALSAHIPNKWEQLTRHLGFYSTRKRGERNKAQQEPVTDILPLPEPDEHKAISKTWAALIKKVYELDPLVCPKCGQAMKIIAFITDTKVLSKIIKSLRLPEYRAPPKLAPSQTEATFYDAA